MPTPTGSRPHRVFVQNPAAPVPDGDGAFTPTWVDLVPNSLFVSVEAPAPADLERLQAETSTAAGLRTVRGNYHPQITTQSRLILNGRILSVVGVSDPDARQVELVLLCVEQVA